MSVSSGMTDVVVVEVSGAVEADVVVTGAGTCGVSPCKYLSRISAQ